MKQFYQESNMSEEQEDVPQGNEDFVSKSEVTTRLFKMKNYHHIDFGVDDGGKHSDELEARLRAQGLENFYYASVVKDGVHYHASYNELVAMMVEKGHARDKAR